MTQQPPHPIPYQGSKRRLAPKILDLLPEGVEHFVEPFAGSAAVTLGAAYRGIGEHYWISDSLEALTDLWERIIEAPEEVANGYEALWHEQQSNPRAFYQSAREAFNRDREPVVLLFLLARCVKAAVRFNARGEFNQSPDHRRLGARPTTMRRHIRAAAALLQGRTVVRSADYREVLTAVPDDAIIYMDPPYQGVSQKRDTRYHEQLDRDAFIWELAELNSRHVRYIVSFDGVNDAGEVGSPLPAHLRLHRILIDAGVSSQGTLLGRRTRTIESLYLSPAIFDAVGDVTLSPHPLGIQPPLLRSGS